MILDNERSSRSFTSKPTFQSQFIINKIWSGWVRAGAGRGPRAAVTRLDRARYRPTPASQRRGKFARN